MVVVLAGLLVACVASSGGGPAGVSPGDGDARDSAADSGADDSGPRDTGTTGTAWPRLYVNELMAANETAVADENGQYADWLELFNPGTAAVDLSGWYVSDDWTDPTRQVLPAGLAVGAGGWLVLWASGDATAGPDHLGFGLSQQGEGLGLFAPDGEAVDWVTWASQQPDHAWARLPDGGEDWVETAHGTPGEANQVLVEEVLDVVNAGATWRYDDSGTDLGSAWREAGFDDGTWATGPAPLGYRDDQATVVSYGADAAAKHPTTYFRLTFDLDAGTADGATAGTVSVVVDDGTVVWLNGQEVGRVNMADGEPTHGTWASATVSGSDETAWTALALDPALLLDGENVLAVEVHQASPSSSDLSFDLALQLEATVSGR